MFVLASAFEQSEQTDMKDKWTRLKFLFEYNKEEASAAIIWW